MSMIAFAGNTASVIYTVESSGALAAADSGPTYTLYKNGSVVDTTSGTPTVTLTASTIATGVYRVSYTVPGSGFAVNDVLELFAATGSTGSAVVGRWVILPASLLTLPSFPTNFASLGISVGGAISNVTTAGSVTSGVTLAATTHTGATIPTVTTVTNLTNAPTSGDLTATMKASVTAAVPSVTQIRTEMDTNSTQLAAILAAVLAQNNLSSLANMFGPGVMEIPSSGTVPFKFTLAIKDNEGKAVNLDSPPTITVVNPSGTSRAAGLSSVTNTATGEYEFTYTQFNSAVAEQLTYKAAGTVSGEARTAYWVSVVADYDATSMLAAISAAVDLVKAKTDNLPASPAAVGSAMTLTSAYDAAKTAASQTSVDAVKTDTGNLVNRITSTLFSGMTSLGRWLGLLAGRTADSTTLAEINATTAGATYANSTDSLEAIRDRGDASWAGGGGGMTGAYAVTITVTDGTSPVPGALVRLKAGAAEDLKKTNGSGVAVFSADDNTYSVRITADGLTFTPASLVVTGDTSHTYEMTEVMVDDTVWATGDDLVAYADASTIGQMIRDDGVKVQLADVPTHPIVARMLMLATSEVNSALQVSNRYSIEQMASMTDVGLEHLKWLTCAIALWHLRQRRINSDPDKQALDRKIITDHLDRLRRGETVLGIESAQEAGIGEAVTFTQADQQRGTPLLRDRMSGTQGVFPSRRFNPRSGQ